MLPKFLGTVILKYVSDMRVHVIQYQAITF